MKPKVLALMGAASFCAGVWHKRYSGQQEIASKNSNILKFLRLFTIARIQIPIGARASTSLSLTT
jgi:hypothetical protein